MATLDLSLTYRSLQFHLEGTLTVGEPQLIFLSGDNGAGKSTLLRLIAGHRRPERGFIKINNDVVVDLEQGRCQAPEDRPVAWQSQQDALFPHVDIETNITWWQRHKRGIEFLERLGLSRVLKVHPDELSGGQRALAHLARTLARPAPLVLLDEPFASLDDEKHRRALEVLNDEVQHGRTILAVVHNATRYPGTQHLNPSPFSINV